MAERQLPRDAYTVGWISALPLELTAAKLMIDELHAPLDSQPKSDDNIYFLGGVGPHNVVFLCLPCGKYGTISAATAVATLRSTFTSIRFALMVGIGGGAPTMVDVRLGDVVVSKPTGTFGGVVQYDFGKALPNGLFERAGSLDEPPSILLNAISGLESDPITTRKQVSTSIQSALERAEATQDPLQFQRPRHDWLFESSYHHESGHPDCSNCDRSQLVKRSERPSTELMIHYGLIASGSQVIKDSETRDEVARDLGVICFEMEAAGIMNQCPSLVIRGISDYCDSHKNDQWQGYSAAAAAAYAKQLLKAIPEPESHNRKRQSTNFTKEEQQCLRSLSSTDPSDDKARLIRHKGNRVSSTCSWFLDTEEIALWLGKASGMTGGSEERNILWLHGNPGTGKSTMAITLVEELPQTPYFRVGDNVLAYFFCDTGTEDNRTAISILGALLKQLIWQRPRFVKHLMQKFTRRGNQLFTSFDGLWAVLMDISKDSGDTRMFCVIDALDECYGESQQTLLRQIDEVFGRCDANYVKPKNLHILVTSRPYPEISQYLDSFYNRDLASYPAVADDLKKVIGEKARKLARLKKYTSEVNAQIEQILEEKADGTFLWVGIACSELEDTPSWKAVAALQKLPRGLHSLYSNLLHSAIDMNKDDQPLITRMLEFLVIAREPPTVAGLSGACQLFVNESEANRLQFTREVIGLCRLIIVIDGDLVRLLHKSVKDFLVKDSGKVDELKANATLTYRCIDYLLAEQERLSTTFDEFVVPMSLGQLHIQWYEPEHASLTQDMSTATQEYLRRFFSNLKEIVVLPFLSWTGCYFSIRRYRDLLATFLTRGDWFWHYSAKYWPEHASLAQNMFTVTRDHQRYFFGDPESWENWREHHSGRETSPIYMKDLPFNSSSILHVAVCWNIAPLVTAVLQSSEEDSSSEEQMFIDDDFKTLDKKTYKHTTPLEEAATHGHTNIMALLLSKSPNDQIISPNVLKRAAANHTKGMELMDMLLKRCLQVTEDVICVAAGNERLGKEIINSLLGRKQESIQITKQVVEAAVRNRAHDREIMKTLLNRRDQTRFTNDAMAKVCKHFDKGIISNLLDRQECQINSSFGTPEYDYKQYGSGLVNSLMVAAAGNVQYGAEATALLLRQWGDQITISADVIEAAAFNYGSGVEVLTMLLKQREDQVQITEAVLKAAARNVMKAREVLEILLNKAGNQLSITEDVIRNIIDNPRSNAVFQLLTERQQVLPPVSPSTAARLIEKYEHKLAVSILLLQEPKPPLFSKSKTQQRDNLHAEVIRILLYEDIDANLMMNISTAASGIVEKSGEVAFQKREGYVKDRVTPVSLEIDCEESKEKATSAHGRHVYLPIMGYQLAVLVSWIDPKIIELLFVRAEDKSRLITSLLDIAESNLAGRESLDILLNRQHASVIEALSGVNTYQLITSAAKIGSRGFMSLILSLRGNEPINMQDSWGRTPLFHAAKNGHYEVAELLLDAGSNPDHTDVHGWHPWALASHCGHQAVRHLLFQAYYKSRRLTPSSPNRLPDIPAGK
ncbi:hypothetical protein BDV09DRAFT_81832 [Aspergillus tetrazonus]